MPKGLDYLINIKDGDFGGAQKAKKEVQGMDDAVQNVNEHVGGLGGAIGKMGLVLGGLFATEKIIEFGKESREAFRKSEAAAAQVNAAIATTGGIAGRGLDQLREKAEALEQTTLFGDEDTLAADSLLLTFTNIRGAIFDNAIPAIQDMAQRMAGDGPADLKGAAIQVGKALNDPIAGINALRRVGVSFSDAQKAQIATLVKHGDIQKAQTLILKELNTEFGGSAAAARKVLGPMGDLDQQTEELKKSFGKLVTEGLNAIVPALVQVVHFGLQVVSGFGTIAGALETGYNWAKKNADIFEALGIGIAAAGAAFLIANPAIILYGIELGVTAVASGALSIASGILTAAQWALNAAMTANPIGLIVTGIGMLIGGLVIAYKRSSEFRAAIAGIGEVASTLVPIFKGLGETILGALTFDPAMVARGFEDAYNGVQKIIDNGGITGTFKKGYKDSLDQSRKDELADAAKDKANTLTAPMQAPTGKAQPFSVSGGKGKKGSGDDSTTLSGGQSVRNVQVTIGKLIEHLTIQNTNIAGLNSADIKRQLTELLVGVVHDSELALGT